MFNLLSLFCPGYLFFKMMYPDVNWNEGVRPHRAVILFCVLGSAVKVGPSAGRGRPQPLVLRERTHFVKLPTAED